MKTEDGGNLSINTWQVPIHGSYILLRSHVGCRKANPIRYSFMAGFEVGRSYLLSFALRRGVKKNILRIGQIRSCVDQMIAH